MISISVVVPATNHPRTLSQCLEAIGAARGAPAEVIVVDHPPRIGPAGARNRGARQASGEILVFVDADVLVHPDAFERIRQAFSDDETLTAVFGSYDDQPAAGGIVSDFRNLLHHHVHRQGAGPATTFWAGLGAIRRDAFLGVGGFDDQRFPRPSIEDIELGMRVFEQGGRIVLDPQIQGKHLKRWTIATMVKTDFYDRGVPWVELLLARSGDNTTLNLGWRHRGSAAASVLFLISLVGRRPRAAVGAVSILCVLNGSFYRTLVRRRGWRQGVAGIPLHIVHHLTGVAAVPVAVAARLRRQKAEHRGVDPQPRS